MTAKELKASILDLAVRGKLVPQDPNDEPASVLLEKIRAEKQKLVKAGKIKKEKNPSEIYIASDGRPYEKFADGSETCIEDEIPFDLPPGWAWARLGGVIELVSGRDLNPDEYNDQTRGTIYITGPSCLSDEGVLQKRWTTAPSVFAHMGDVLLVCKGAGYGKTVICDVKEAHIARQIMAIRKSGHLDMKYVRLYLDANIAFIKGHGQGVIPGIDRGCVLALLFPVPPVLEQRRIVAKIDELSKKLNEYSEAQSKLTGLCSTFAPTLKRSILKSAVEGKLVPQDPKNEPVEKLLERIAAERKALVKAGKIKHDKHESVIFRGSDRLTYETRDGETVCIENELPFKIPESWAWVRLGSICSFIHRGKSPQYSPIKKCPVVAQKCNQWSGFCIEKAQFIDPETISKYTQEQFLQDDDLLWNSTGLGTLGRMAMYATSLNPYKIAVADSHVTVIRVLKDFVDPQYVFSYLTGPSVQSVIEDKADGSTKQKELSTSTVVGYLVPLPPLAEQKRIVAQIEKMLKVSAALTT